MAEGSASDGPNEPVERSDDTILHKLGRRTGRVPRVSLSDAGTDAASPLIDPKSHALQDELSHADQGKYRILGEIARGGMGVILRGHDVELGRDVAIKVVDAELASRAEVVERFVEEAQIGGQLQHPGIVPVYELGLMADERPYFTMKLIKGRTLAALLARRKSPDEERTHFLQIFESVCQTMAYAHSKGVIHRDLKPANIMVGAFGEVQVVDWGLSKVLRRGGVDDELAARDTALTVIETVRSGPGSGSDSLAGNVLGTPAYMSPEQAQGEIAKLDERTDVFALGAILCEILTGAPPYAGPKGENLVRRAALAELDDARERIRASTTSEELKKLCETCLMPSRAARPRDAEEVATTVREHLSGLEKRVQEERLRAERSRRRAQLVTLVGALLLLAGGGGWWIRERERTRETELVNGYEAVHAEVLRHERDGDLERAVDAARGGVRLVESGVASPELRERAAELLRTTEERWNSQQEHLAELERESRLLEYLDETQARYLFGAPGVPFEEISASYREAYLAFGIDLDAPELPEVLTRYRGTPLGIRLALGFDAWAAVLRGYRRDATPQARVSGDEVGYLIELVTGIGLDLDPDPLRAEVRMALVENDVAPLVELVEAGRAADAEPESLFLLGVALCELGEQTKGLEVLTVGADEHPDSFHLAYAAGFFHIIQGYAQRAESYLMVAVALRPGLAPVHYKLGEARSSWGDAAGAAEAGDRAFRLAPELDWDQFGIGIDFLKAGRFEAALEYLDRNAASKPESDVAYYNSFDLPRFARAMAGELSIDDYFDWVERHGYENDDLKWSRPYLLISVFCPPGVQPQPERVLDRLARYTSGSFPDVDVWMAVGASQALVGDGAGALAAANKLARIAEGDHFYGTIATLLAASGEALLGERERAAELLARARSMRDHLYSGREALWSGGSIDMAFERFEPIALGK